MLLILFLFFFSARLYNNGVGKVPAMGWNSWNQYGCHINGMISNGLDKVGFKYINLDDCWQLVDRDSKGNVVVDPKAFPNGIKYLSDMMHKNNLNFGLYTDIGFKTCQGRAGSYGYYDIDAKQYAEWEVDYVKCDFGYTTQDEPWKFYSNFSNYLNKTGRHILFSLCEWGVKDPWKWAPAIGNSWRTTGDIGPSFDSVLNIMHQNQDLNTYSGLYSYNDPDMLEVGVVRENKQLSLVENKAHFTIWCFLASPLLLGLDLAGTIEPDILNILTNSEVISINQDELGKQGWVVAENKEHIVDKKCVATHGCVWTQTWFVCFCNLFFRMKPLTNNRIGVMMLNHAAIKEGDSDHFNKDEKITVNWKDIGLDPGKKMKVRDIWGHKDLGVFQDHFDAPAIGQHDVFAVILSEDS